MLTNKNIITFLQKNYDSDATELSFLAKGMFSQVFSFLVSEKKFVIRFNQFEQDFLKDSYAYEHFACNNIPIPPIIKIGKYNNNYSYAISPYCPGETLATLTAQKMQMLLPDFITAVHQIHTIDLSGHAGYGLMNEYGTGLFNSWQASLKSLDNRKLKYEWNELFHQTFLEQNLFMHYKKEMFNLVAFCPE